MLEIDEKIMQLISDKTGDTYRLEEMLVRLRTGKALYNSDKKYIDIFFPDSQEAEEIVIVEKSKSKKPRRRKLNKKRALILLSSILILLFIAVITITLVFPVTEECADLFSNYSMIGYCILETIKIDSLMNIGNNISDHISKDIDRLSNFL